MPERHRLNFYIGHVEAFDWNMICAGSLGLDPFNPAFDSLFAFGIDPGSTDLPTDRPADWPGLAETHLYCRKVRRAVDDAIDAVPEDVSNLCIEHRLMHAETLCYLLQNLPPERMVPRNGRQAATQDPSGGAALGEWVVIPAGQASLGRARGTGFGWDNEFEGLLSNVPEFECAKHKVTNGEYLSFVEAGGARPHYWRWDGRRWMLRTMFGEVPLPLDWPVYVTHAQARRFAARVEASLPSEAQWDRAAYGSESGLPRRFPWGDGDPSALRANVDFRRWDPCAVDANPDGDSAYGVSQAAGNGWEWTADLFRPFPGFEAHPLYPGYSADFFDSEHYVMKGGSPRTARALLRRTFRNWFRGDYPYMFATFRLVRH